MPSYQVGEISRHGSLNNIIKSDNQVEVINSVALLNQYINNHSIYISIAYSPSPAPLELSRRVQLAASVPKYNAAVRIENSRRRDDIKLIPLMAHGTAGWEQVNQVGKELRAVKETPERPMFTTPRHYLPDIRHLVKAGAYIQQIYYSDYTSIHQRRRYD